MAFDPKSIRPASKSREFSRASGSRSARDVLLASLDNQLALFRDPTVEGRRWFVSGKSETAFSLRYSNRALVLLDEEKQVVVPTPAFEDALSHYRAEIQKGKFDDQLEVMSELVNARKAKMATTRASKKQGQKPPVT